MSDKIICEGECDAIRLSHSLKTDHITYDAVDALNYAMTALMIKKPNSNGRWCVLCRARDKNLRNDICFDCATKAENKALERNVFQHIIQALYNVYRLQFYYAKIDLEWAWERFTNTGDYSSEAVMERINNKNRLRFEKLYKLHKSMINSVVQAANAFTNFGLSAQKAAEAVSAFARVGQNIRYKYSYPIKGKILSLRCRFHHLYVYTYPGTTFENTMKECFGFFYYDRKCWSKGHWESTK